MATPYSTTPRATPVANIEQFLKGPSADITGDSCQATLLVDARCQLGESILYDDERDCVVFTSILDRTFHKLNLSGDGHLQTFSLPKMLCAMALLDKPSQGVLSKKVESMGHPYLVAWEDGFQLYDLENGKELGEKSEGESVNPLGLPDRLNDGRVDPTGKRFICGGCAGNEEPLKVYACEYDIVSNKLKHRPVVNEIRTTNSICWSPDGGTMYLADSPTLRIDQYSYNTSNGALSNKRFFHKKPTGFADGSCVDAQGYVWNATWRQGEGTGMVDRIDPATGKIVFTVHLPDNTSEASCCCLGGPDLDVLFITTAWEHLDPSKEPHAGGLYAVKLPPSMSGKKEKRFCIA